MAPALLMPFHPKLREYTRKQLVKRGVDIRLNTRILEVAPDQVIIGDGQSLHSDLTIWTGGVAAPAAAAGWGLPQGQHGRILVGPDLRVKGSDRIFAAGDIALEPDDPSPQLAQPALQEGRHAARQIITTRGPWPRSAVIPPSCSWPGACGSPGFSPGSPGSPCTCSTCWGTGTGSRR
jgi:NADH dehydrogenase